MKAKTWVPLLEVLEDRLTPSLTFTTHHGSLTVTGSTASATVTVTSAGNSVTVNDGGTAQTITVTKNLTFNIQMTAAAPTFNYDPGATAPGDVTLKVLSAAGLTLKAAGTSSVDVNGELSITTGKGNDSVSVDNLNPAGLDINTGGGQDFVFIGFNNPVTVRGDLEARNVNLIGLGALNGPAVTIEGSADISTDVVPGITFNMPNNIDIENHTTIQENLYAELDGPFEVFSSQGATNGNVDVNLGNGSNLALFQDGYSVGGNVSVSARGNASTTVSVGSATIGGNFDANLGNGDNTLVFHATLLGRSFSYKGGKGTDSVTLASDASLTDARVRVNLGAGDDTFTLNTGDVRSVFANGGPGNDVANINVPVTFDLKLVNFGPDSGHDHGHGDDQGHGHGHGQGDDNDD
jgi:hypothetical protein